MAAEAVEDKDVESKKETKGKRPMRVKFIRYGAIAGILGTLFAALQPWATEKTISSQLKVDPSSPAYQFWEKVPIPISTRIMIFNVENAEEFLKGGKLRVRELGPFTLSQVRWKEVIEFTDKTVKYYEWRNYTILYEESNGSWDQEITVLNPLVASLGSIVGDTLEKLIPVPLAVSPFVYSAVSGLLLAHSQNFFLKTTPRNLIIGQRVNLLDTVTTLIKPLELLGVKASDLIPTEDLPNNTFGLINGKNYTRIGPWEVYTGTGVAKEFYTKVVSFKNERLSKRWAGNECNTPKGTDGIQFQPLINRTSKLTIFASDIYRWLDLAYVEDTDFFGIPVYKYIIAPEMFQPPSVNPENACWCVHKGKKKSRCEVAGVIDCTGGFSGSPFVVSKPHFLDAPGPLKLIDGLSPDPEKHLFYLLIKPDIGVPISVRGRIQLNLRVERVPFLRGFSNIRDTIFPIAWIEEGGELDDFFYYLVKGGLVITPMVASAGFYSVAIGGWAAFIGGLLYIVARKSGKSKVANVEKLFAPRMSPTKEQLINDKNDKSVSKMPIGQNQQGNFNGVLVPVDYNQSSEAVNNALNSMMMNGYNQQRDPVTGPISIIPINSQDSGTYQSSPMIQFYRFSPAANSNGQFDQLLLTLPSSNGTTDNGTVPKIMWNERPSKSMKERTAKVREKMTRGRSLPPRERADQRSKRIQVTSKDTQDRFVQTRTSLSEVIARSVSATMPGTWASGDKKVDDGRSQLVIRTGLRSTYSALSQYQSKKRPETDDDDDDDETTLFQRESTTESEAATPQSGYDTTDERQEVNSYQRDGINGLPGVETPDRSGTPSFSDEFSLGSSSRPSTTKGYVQSRTSNRQEEPKKSKSTCILS